MLRVLLWCKRTGIVTALAWVTAVMGVPSLAWEIPHAVGAAKNKKIKMF